MSSLFGQVWFWSLLAFLVGAVLTWVLLVRPAQQRVQQLERQPRNGRAVPSSGHAQPQQIPPRPAQQSPRAPQPPAPAWPGQQQDPENVEHHERTRWLERDSLQDARRSQAEREQQERAQTERTQAERVQQVPEQWPDASAQRPGVTEPPPQPPQAFGQPGQHAPAPGQRPDVPAPGQPAPAPGPRPDVPDQHTPTSGQRQDVSDQRAFVPAEPPVPYGQEEDVQQELERQYREEFGHDYPEDDREYTDEAQGYPEDDRAYQGDTQDYAPEYERDYADDYADDEFTGRVHPSSYADAAPGGVRDRLEDIDEQPELSGLGDFDADSGESDQRSAHAQRPGGLFEPSGPAEQVGYTDDGYTDNGYETNGYAGAQPSGVGAGAGLADDAAPSEPGPEQDDATPDTDPVTGLPKRRRGASNRIKGGFAPPRPIEPSIRPVARRTPQRDGGSSGSLFEPSAGEQAGAVAQTGGYAQAGSHGQPGSHAQPGAHADTTDVPPGPFGPGSAMPLPGGGRPDPSFTVKASVTELRYCAEGSPHFASMTPEVWFATPGDAERVGFRPIP